jgi:hypothetical protein
MLLLEGSAERKAILLNVPLTTVVLDLDKISKNLSVFTVILERKE